jgi:hypothetical protein
MNTTDKPRRIRETQLTVEVEQAPDGTWTGRFDALGLVSPGHATERDPQVAAARAMVDALNEMPNEETAAWFEANTTVRTVVQEG